MTKFLLSIFTVAVFAGSALAQTSAQTQTSGSVSDSSSVSASRSGAQAQSTAGASAASQSAVSEAAGNHSAAANTSNHLAAGSTIHAQLEKPVDARKSKPGDAVYAKTTQNVKSDGKTVVPKGSRIVGHVTEAKAREKGQSESTLGIAFDHAVLKDGSEVPMSASIQAIASSQASASDSLGEEPMMAEGAGGMAAGRATAGDGGVLGGATHAVGTSGGVLANTAGTVSGTAGGTLSGATSASGALSSTSHGVAGLKGLSLNSAVANSTQGSLITSSTRSVHLDSGTQMILQVAGK